jgi:predicted HicB family RNase H-like nuclease
MAKNKKTTTKPTKRYWARPKALAAFRLDEELIQAVKEEAFKQKVTLTQFVTEALISYLQPSK